MRAATRTGGVIITTPRGGGVDRQINREERPMSEKSAHGNGKQQLPLCMKV